MTCCNGEAQGIGGTKQTANKEEKGEGNVRQGSEIINKLGREEGATNAAGFKHGNTAHTKDGTKVETAELKQSRVINNILAKLVQLLVVMWRQNNRQI